MRLTQLIENGFLVHILNTTVRHNKHALIEQEAETCIEHIKRSAFSVKQICSSILTYSSKNINDFIVTKQFIL